MTESLSNADSSNDLLQSIIADFLDAESKGQPLNREAWLAQHASHADSLKEFLANHDRMKQSAPSELDDVTLAPDGNTHNDATLPPDVTGATKSSETQAGDRVHYFGDYELLEEIARGGMGVVYKAKQINLNRIVALKMILAGQLASEQDVQRFRTEAESAANLDHPRIVPIYEVGQHAGQHYFSMGYVDGKSLAQKLVDGPMAPREAAEMLVMICEGISYAHEQGVIHRDLKPANILLDRNEEPKVTDFGLAKKLGSDSNLTGTGQILGTPSYMAPEQASGKIDEVGPLADVYALGAILYCLLTGRPPFQASNQMDTLLQVLEKEPIPPRKLNSTVPIDLETIALKCLDKVSNRRYGNVEELSDDLIRWCKGLPIKARAASKFEICWRWVKRNQAVSVLASSIAVILVVSTIVALSLAYWAIRESQNSKRAMIELGIEKDRARESEYIAKINLAHKYIVSEDASAASRILKELIPHQGDTEYRDFEYYYYRNVLSDDKRRREEERASKAEETYFDDGNRWWGNRLDPFSAGGRLNEFVAIAVSHNNRKVALCNANGQIFLTNRDTRDRQPMPSDQSVCYSAVAFNSKGTLLVGSGSDGTATVWNVGDHSIKASFPSHDSNVVRANISADDRLLGTGCWDGSVYVWEIDSGRLILKHQPQNVKEASVSGNGAEAKVSGELHATVYRRRLSISSLEFGGNGRWLRFTDGTGVVRILDVEHYSPDREPQTFMRAEFVGISDAILSLEPSGLITIRDLQNKLPPQDLFNHKFDQAGVPIIEVADDGSQAVIVSGNTISVWDLSSVKELNRWEMDTGKCVAMAISPNKKRLTLLRENGTAQLLELPSGTLVLPGLIHQVPGVQQAANDYDCSFSAGGEFLLISAGGQLQVARGETLDASSKQSEVPKALACDLEYTLQQQSSNNLKNIALAFFNYESVNKRFPDTATKGNDGSRLLSWRVTILPYLEQQELYDAFHHDEPWDSDHNLKLLERMPQVYGRPGTYRLVDGDPAPPGHTTYHLPVAPGTIFEGGIGRRVRDIIDGTSNTILILDSSTSTAVPWTKPDDLDRDLNYWVKAMLSKGTPTPITLADGSVQTLLPGINASELRKLLTRNGGEFTNQDLFQFLR